jgi:pSer/pThr/pTyr-binding forkhead associated (FHA) protein
VRDMKKETPVLLAHNGPLNGLNWNISDILSIGRGSECDIIINDRQVSRVHAQIRTTKSNQIFLEDLDSKNGTFLNGEIISEPMLLKDGDEIKIALIQKFIFISSDATLPLDRSNAVEPSVSKELFIDKKARRVWLGEKELTPPLSVSQYDLLLYLYENEGKVVSREESVDRVWGDKESIGVTEQAIDALVRRLRTRLIKQDPTHGYIITVRGVGYILQNDNFLEKT